MATVCSIKDSHRYTSRVYDKLANKFSALYNSEINKKPGEIDFKNDEISLNQFMVSEYPELMKIYLDKDFSQSDAHYAVMKLIAMIPKILSKGMDKKMDVLSDNDNEKIKSVRFSTALAELGIKNIDVLNHIEMMEAQDTAEDYIYYIEGLVTPKEDNSFVEAVDADLVNIKEDKPFTKEQKENEPNEILEEPIHYSFVGQGVNSNTIHKDKKIVVVPPTAFSDAQTSIEKSLDNPNAFYFKVVRKLISDFNFAKMNGLKLKVNNEEVVLTAMNMSELNREDYGSRTSVASANKEGRIILVATNRAGTPFRFNKDGEHDYSGEVAYILLRDTSKVVKNGVVEINSYEKSGVKHLQKITGKSYSESEKIYTDELLMLDNIRKIVTSRKVKKQNSNEPIALNSEVDSSIQFDINGGTLGLSSGNSTNKTRVSDINMDTNKTRIILTKTEDKVKGFDINRLYLVDVDGYHGQPIRLTTESIDSSTIYDDVNLADYLTDLMTLDFKGTSRATLKDIVDEYMFLGPDGFTMSLVNNEYKLFFTKELIDHTTEEGKSFIRNKFSEINIYQEVTTIGGRKVIAPKKVYAQEDIDSLVMVKNNKGTKYYNLSKMKFKTSSASKSQVIKSFKIQKIKKEDGVNKLEKSNLTYYNFIRNNTTTKAELTIENKLEKVGAYLTFEPTEKTLNSIGATKVDTQIKEIEDAVGEKQKTNNAPIEEKSMYLFNQETGEGRDYISDEINPQMLKELGYGDIQANIIMNSMCG